MALYEIELSDGSIVELEADREPTESEVSEALGLSSKKPFWSAVGADISPEMRKAHPYLSAVADTGRDMFATPAAYFNQWLLNNPRSILNKVGIEYPQPESTAGKAGYYAAGVAGAVQNPLAKVMGVGKIPAATSPLKTLGLASAQGGALGAAYAPEDFTDIKTRGKQAITGAVVNSVISMFPKLITLTGNKTGYKIAEKADKGFDKAKSFLSDKYDDMFDRIRSGDAQVDDLAQMIDDHVKAFPEDSGLSKLTSISERLRGKGRMSAKELHNLKQEIRTTTPKSVWQGTSDPNAMQHSKMELYFKINDKLESMGGDEYIGLSNEYRNFMQNQRLAKQFFYEKGIASDLNLNKPMSYRAKEAISSIEKGLSDEERFLTDFLAWRRGQSFKKYAPGVALTTGAAAWAAQKLKDLAK